MNRQDRVKLLAESVREEVRKAEEERVRKAEEERDFNAQVARVAAIAKPEIEKILAQYKAETSQPMKCPNCGELLPDSWRPSEETSGINEDDDVNEDDDTDDDDDDRELHANAKSRIVAELLNRKRRK